LEIAHLIDGESGEVHTVLFRVAVPGIVIAVGFRSSDQVEQPRPAPGDVDLAQRGKPECSRCLRGCRCRWFASRYRPGRLPSVSEAQQCTPLSRHPLGSAPPLLARVRATHPCSACPGSLRGKTIRLLHGRTPSVGPSIHNPALNPCACRSAHRAPPANRCRQPSALPTCRRSP
jgi:hypothetical protein